MKCLEGGGADPARTDHQTNGQPSDVSFYYLWLIAINVEIYPRFLFPGALYVQSSKSVSCSIMIPKRKYAAY